MSTFEFATLRVGKHRAGPSSWFIGLLHRERFTLALITLTAAAMMALAAGAAHQIDLTEPGSNGDLNGARVEHVPAGDVSGSGVFDPFLRVQARGVQNGFNTDARKSGQNQARYLNDTPEFNASDPKTVAINLARVPTVTHDGTVYREIYLDMNEAGNSPFLSLDLLEVYLTNQPAINGLDRDNNTFATPVGNQSALVYTSKTHTALLEDLSTGSGRPDYRFLIPDALFDDGGACGFGAPIGAGGCGLWMVVDVEMGATEDAGATSTFEEWSVKKYPYVEVTKTANGSFTRTHEWEIEKSVDPDDHDLFVGDTADSTYTVTVTNTDYSDSDHQVTGSITITNTSALAASVSSVDDVLADGTVAPVTCPNAYPFPLAAGASVVCTYTASPADDSAAENTATVTLATGTVHQGSATVSFTATVVDDEVDVTDQFDGGTEGAIPGQANPTTVGLADLDGDGKAEFTYDRTFSCDDVTWADDTALVSNPYEYDDTARVKSGDTALESDDATVTVTCYRPGVDKDADAAYTLTHDWDIEKSADPVAHDLFEGDTADSTYTVTVTNTGSTNSEFAVTGTISVTNPHPDDPMTVTIADELDDGTTATIGPCTSGTLVGDQLTVAAGDTATCDYTASPTDDSATENTATVTLNTNDYTADAAVDWEAATVTVVDDEVDVTDQFDGGTEGAIPGQANPTTVGLADLDGDGKAEFTYDRTFSCDDVTWADDTALVSNPYEYDDTARVKSGDTALESDDATVTVTCYRPGVDKDADAAYTLTHDWDIAKTSDADDPILLLPGESTFVGYEVTVTLVSSTESDLAVSGTISVTNPHPTDPMMVTIADVLDDGTIATIGPCTSGTLVGDQLTVAAGDTATCDYTASPTDDSATENTATVTLNTNDYTADAAVDWEAATVTEVHATITVDDDRYGGTLGEVIAGDPVTTSNVGAGVTDTVDGDEVVFSYDIELGPWTAEECGPIQVDNTAEFDSGEGLTGDADHTVNIEVECSGFQGCTPGFWQGGNGSTLWDMENDTDWLPSGGGAGTQPYTHDTLFNDFFTSHPNLEGLTMFDLVSTGGGSDPVRKAARSLVAAYLNASHEDVAYPYTTTELKAMWDAAVADDSFQALHTLLDETNNLGCFDDVETANAAMALPLLPLGAAWLAYRRRRR